MKYRIKKIVDLDGIHVTTKYVVQYRVLFILWFDTIYEFRNIEDARNWIELRNKAVKEYEEVKNKCSIIK